MYFIMIGFMINIVNCWKKEICSNIVVIIGDYVFDFYIYLVGYVI